MCVILTIRNKVVYLVVITSEVLLCLRVFSPSVHSSGTDWYQRLLRHPINIKLWRKNCVSMTLLQNETSWLFETFIFILVKIIYDIEILQFLELCCKDCVILVHIKINILFRIFNVHNFIVHKLIIFTKYHFKVNRSKNFFIH